MKRLSDWIVNLATVEVSAGWRGGKVRFFFNGWDVTKVCRGARVPRIPWLVLPGKARIYASECVSGPLSQPTLVADKLGRCRTVWRKGRMSWKPWKREIPLAKRAVVRQAWRAGDVPWRSRVYGEKG